MELLCILDRLVFRFLRHACKEERGGALNRARRARVRPREAARRQGVAMAGLAYLLLGNPLGGLCGDCFSVVCLVDHRRLVERGPRDQTYVVVITIYGRGERTERSDKASEDEGGKASRSCAPGGGWRRTSYSCRRPLATATPTATPTTTAVFAAIPTRRSPANLVSKALIQSNRVEGGSSSARGPWAGAV
jgi:hypothetical protein